MARILLTISIFCGLIACEGPTELKTATTANQLELSITDRAKADTRSKYDSVAYKTFGTGGGLGGYSINFIDHRTYSTFGFCDICPGGGEIGTYIQKSKEIFMLDSVCFENKPHFTNPRVYVNCEGSTMTHYFLVRNGNKVYLSSNPADTLNPQEMKTDSYPYYEISIPTPQNE